MPWAVVAFAVGVHEILQSRLRPIGKCFTIYLLTMTILGGLTRELEGLSTALRAASTEQLVLLFVFLAAMRSRINLTPYLKASALIVTVAILFSSDRTHYVTLMQNPSMASTFVVVASGVSPYSFLIALLCHSWTASACFVAGTLFRHRKTPWARLCACIAVLGVGFECFRGIPDNGRVEIWKTYLSFWWQHGSILWGVGPGTTRIWLPFINYAHATGDGWMLYVWAHCDWLQLLVETGAVGLFLGLLAFGEAFKYSRKKSEIVAYAVAMSANMVLHWPLLALVGWALITD